MTGLDPNLPIIEPDDLDDLDGYITILLWTIRRIPNSVIHRAKIGPDNLPIELRGDLHRDWNRTEIAKGYSLLDQVPLPDADLDIALAWREYLIDRRTAFWLLERPELPFPLKYAVALNQWDWAAFLGMRHSDRSLRLKFIEQNGLFEATGNQVLVAAQTYFAKQNIILLPVRRALEWHATC